MIAQTQSKSALSHAEKQRIECKLKEIEINMWQMKAEYETLQKLRDTFKGHRREPEVETLLRPIVNSFKPKPPSRKRPKTTFCEAKLASIPALVASGMCREEIAKQLQTTVASLQVTCHRHKISLRRPLTSYQRKPNRKRE